MTAVLTIWIRCRWEEIRGLVEPWKNETGPLRADWRGFTDFEAAVDHYEAAFMAGRVRDLPALCGYERCDDTAAFPQRWYVVRGGLVDGPIPADQ